MCSNSTDTSTAIGHVCTEYEMVKVFMSRTVCAPLNQQGTLFISTQLSSKFTFITFSTDSIFGNSQQSRKQPNTNRSLVIVIIIIITDVIIIIITADVFSLSMQMSHFHDNALLVGLAAVSDRVSVLSVYYCAFIPQEETSSSRFIVTLFSVFGKSLLF